MALSTKRKASPSKSRSKSGSRKQKSSGKRLTSYNRFVKAVHHDSKFKGKLEKMSNTGRLKAVAKLWAMKKAGKAMHMTKRSGSKKKKRSGSKKKGRSGSKKKGRSGSKKKGRSGSKKKGRSGSKKKGRSGSKKKRSGSRSPGRPRKVGRPKNK